MVENMKLWKHGNVVRALKTLCVFILAYWHASTFAYSSIGLGWDALAPGTQVRGFTETPIAGSATVESHVYVGNATAVSKPNCLVYDFSDFPAGKPRGYQAVSLPAATNGWTVLSLCFRPEGGSVSGEIRGLYDLPGQKLNGVKRSWPFLWLSFDEMFSVKAEGKMRWEIVRVGSVMPKVWHRATIHIPPPGATNAVATATLERMDGKGDFKKVGEAKVPFGNLVLRKTTSFDLTGSGPCKFHFDDIAYSFKEGKDN